jgi:exopolysaccharide production protein ExoQ
MSHTPGYGDRAMNKLSKPKRAELPHTSGLRMRSAGPTVRKAGASGVLILLTVLFWFIFYQNLPDNWGLNAVAGQALGNTPAVPAAYSANVLDRIIKVSMISISLCVIATHWSMARLLAKSLNPGLTAFLALTLASAAWSIDSAATTLRFVTLASVVLVCFAIPLVTWDPRRLQRLVVPPVIFILLASLVVGSLYPDRIIEIGLDASQYNAWHGITFSKNFFGLMSSIGVVLCANRWLGREGSMVWSLAGALMAFVCLILSRSNTSLLATLVSVGFMVLVMRVPIIRNRFSTHVVIAIGATLLLYELIIQDVVPGVDLLLAPIARLFGKDTSFSARTMIWSIIKEHISSAPYLGTGYGAYWTGPTPESPSYIFVHLMYFYPTEAHNGYLEVVNDVGLVGLVVLLAFLFLYMRQGLRLLRVDRNQAALYLAFLYQQMVINMSESEWFSRSSSFAVVFLAVTCMARALLEQRLRAQQSLVGTA